ncbi:MAG: family 16 glycosylhydrolase [Saprospiraceae bacterium]|nr:family 16 glycosylhydrolase [Saprospiraceae bacterium]
MMKLGLAVINKLNFMKNTYRICISALILFNWNLIHSQNCGSVCNWPQVYIKETTFECSEEAMIFFDDFNGTSLNEGTWQTHFWLENDNLARVHDMCEEQIYLENNVSVSNGVCQLTGLYEPSTTWENSNGTLFEKDITSGMIMTRMDDPDAFYRHAKYEARIKIPGLGWWPAFWLFHHDEIDIMENFWNDNLLNYNLYSGQECRDDNVLNTPLDDDQFHTYAADLTPFTLTFYFDGKKLPKKYYRFYSADGKPVEINCEKNYIPEGKYYINPLFPQSFERGFNPIINLAVLPKYGNNCSVCSKLLGCNAPYCFNCINENGNNQNCNWGYPLGVNCDTIGDLPAELQIDYVRITEREMNICNTFMVYGSDCSFTNNFSEPYSCNFYCLGETGTLYFEDLNVRNLDEVNANWQSTPNITNVISSSDIEILNFNNHSVDFIQSFNGDGKINITFLDHCGDTNSLEYILPNAEFEFEIIEIDPCNGNMVFEINNFSNTCQNHYELSSVLGVNKWGEFFNLTYNIEGSKLNVTANGIHLLRNIILNVTNNCNGLIEEYSVDIPKCNICCPPEAEYNGINCVYDISFEQTEPFIYNNAIYSTHNDSLYPENNGCPPGSLFDGENCYYGVHIPIGHTGYIENNLFYSNINCDKYCCPQGYEYDGENCISNLFFFDVAGFINNGSFFSTTNDSLYQINNGCPPGSTYNGQYCDYGLVPLGFEGFAFNGTFYVKPNCKTCCPPGSRFDGANCYFGIHFIGEGIIRDNGFYTIPNDSLFSENYGCPPGTVFNGRECDYNTSFGNEFEGFIFENTFYTKPVDCYFHFRIMDSSDSSQFEKRKIVRNQKNMESRIRKTNEIGIYPNPFSSSFSVDISKSSEQVFEILVTNVDGKLLKRLESADIREINLIEPVLNDGLIFIFVKFNSGTQIFKLIKT